MALIKCAECGKEVSDKAAACPNCGAPVHIREENIQTFDDVYKANGVMTAINPGSIKKAKTMIRENESVLFASMLNVSISPIHGK